MKRNAVAILFFRVSDNSGSATVSGGIYRAGNQLKGFAPKTFRSGRYRYNWRAGSRVEHLSFCLLAQDAAGNRSTRRCAVVSVN